MYGTLVHGHPVMNGGSGFFPPLYWFYYYSGALESFDDYDYGDVLRGLRALGVRYVIVQTDPALVDADKGRATLRAIRRQPDQIVTTRDFGESDSVRASPVGWRAARERTDPASNLPVPGSPPQRRTARTS